jgi:DNA-directed RNA polymerase subunit RPC12/RpoP
MNEQRKRLDRALYNKRKELGLCATCGAELIDKRFVTCRRCRERVKIYKARQKAKKL